jgi:hypothetical protein
MLACLLVLQLSELYTEDYIFDRFSCCASKDGSYFATGSYRFSLLKRMDPESVLISFSPSWSFPHRSSDS